MYYDTSSEYGYFSDKRFNLNNDQDLDQNSLSDYNESNRINHTPSRKSELNFPEKNEPNNRGDIKMPNQFGDDSSPIFNQNNPPDFFKHFWNNDSPKLSHQIKFINQLKSNINGYSTPNQIFPLTPEQKSQEPLNNIEEIQKSREEETGKNETFLGKKR